MSQKPSTRPADPRFSSGPTKKRPGWELAALSGAPLGRTHRGGIPKARLAEAIERTGAMLEIPDDYRVIITPASDTGAMEGAMWSLLGARGVDVFSCDEFGRRWLIDARDELKLSDLRLFEAPFGVAPDYDEADFSRDVIFTWNATSSGVRIPDGDWIPANREGLTLCDATSAAFAMNLPWDKLDVTTFSWQKCMGGEAQHGIAVLSPRARKRLAEHKPAWPVPRILQWFEAAAEDSKMFEGSTINTPSLLATEDYIDSLKWAMREGGLEGLVARTDANFEALADWVESCDWIDYLTADPATRSHTSITLKFSGKALEGKSEEERWAVSRKMAALLDREEAAFDVAPHPKAPAGLRIWCGPTVDTDDVRALGPWLDWAYHEAISELV
ncbi:phosphoserine aminotransferase [Marinicauda pacifica]|uniref:phosphoserine transaminase n=1 Tax=Marinicauda pacifica TaxID=1133559 RepID=A0A4S2HAP2_9PROT|nr:phosphoserine transaminase [Marinicauda pacifica]TGY92997.1 phosphoserine transaminase [Marinicauda pacifica]GGE42017.1 phosphoserine aminotransferase [Marinicauda pacifica]